MACSDSANKQVTKPTLPQLVEALKVTDVDWYVLGTRLSVKNVESIKREHSSDEPRCMVEMCRSWLNGNPDASWTDVIAALKGMNKNTLASTISRKHSCSDNVDQTVTEGFSRVHERRPLKYVHSSATIVQNFECVRFKFSLLLENFLDSIETCEISVGKQKRKLETLNLWPQDLSNDQSMEEVFLRIFRRNILNYKLFSHLVARYDLNEEVKQQVIEYETEVERFCSSVTVKEFMDNVKSAVPSDTAAGEECIKIELKLLGNWESGTVHDFKVFVQHIFGEECALLRGISIKPGCVAIQWYIPSSLGPVLWPKIDDNKNLLKQFGVTRITVKSTELDLASDKREVELNKTLLTAVQLGDKDLVVVALHLGDDNEFDTTKSFKHVVNIALCAASENGHKDIVKLLLEKGADPNAQNTSGNTALGAASNNGHKDIVQLLLEKGADPNTQSNSGNTALGAASENGHKGIVQLLLEKGTDPNGKSNYGKTALFAASESGHEDIVQLLLEKGADPNAQSDFGNTALGAASKNGHKDIIQLLLEKGADPNAQSTYGNTALALASWNGHNNIVQLLLEKGADPNAQNDFGNTALGAAIMTGHKDIVQLLLEKGADPNGKSNYEKTALFAASEIGHKDIVQLLLEKGADPNDARTGNTALGAASENGHKDIVQLLLEKGADPNGKSNYGKTALFIASESGHKDIVQLLLEKGADRNGKSKYGRTALFIASESDHKDIVQFLLEKGADLNIQDYSGKTALYAATKNGHKHIVELLLGESADVNIPDYNGTTALYEASKKGHTDIVQLLIDNGANISSYDKLDDYSLSHTNISDDSLDGSRHGSIGSNCSSGGE